VQYLGSTLYISDIMTGTVWWWVLYTARRETAKVSPSAANVYWHTFGHSEYNRLDEQNSACRILTSDSQLDGERMGYTSL